MAYWPQASSTDGISLVAWAQDGTLKAARISGSTGQVLDTPPISLGATATNGRIPAVAARDGEFLVTWTSSDGGVWSRRVRASDGAMLGTSDIFVGPGALAAPAAVFDGTDYRITWPANRSGVGQLVATRLLSTDVVDAELVVAPLNTIPFGSPRQAFIVPIGPGSFLTAYLQNFQGWGAGIGMRIVSGAMSPEPQACASEEPSLTLAGTAEMTVECGSGTYNDPGAQAFDGCGPPLQVQGYPACRRRTRATGTSRRRCGTPAR